MPNQPQRLLVLVAEDGAQDRIEALNPLVHANGLRSDAGNGSNVGRTACRFPERHQGRTAWRFGRVEWSVLPLRGAFALVVGALVVASQQPTSQMAGEWSACSSRWTPARRGL